MVLESALIISAIISAVGSAAATVGNVISTAEANKANKDINFTNNAFNASQADIDRQFQATQAQDTRVFNAAEAEKQRQWEQQMSNTEVQRRAADLQAAGFNPMLAATGASASTPGAATATSGMVGGSRANASGYIPMRAMDFSPMAAMANNLGYLVTSARYMQQLNAMAHNNPALINGLVKAGGAMSSSMTRASKVPSYDKLTGEIKSMGLDRVLDKYI